ncbi:TPA: hypothetical protein ACOAXM_003621 [Vibrio cholerae]
MIAEQSEKQLILHIVHVAGRRQKRNDYRGNPLRNGIFSVAILLILIMD